MASVTGASICIKSVSCSLKQTQRPSGFSSMRSVSLPISGKSCFPSLRSSKGVSSLQICCARFDREAADLIEKLVGKKRIISSFRNKPKAKPQTVEKVCEIVKKQLALPEDSEVTGDSKFSALGADSLDTVEIVMGLVEEFGFSVDEKTAQSILTVQDAADLIEKVVELKRGPPFFLEKSCSTAGLIPLTPELFPLLFPLSGRDFLNC